MKPSSEDLEKAREIADKTSKYLCSCGDRNLVGCSYCDIVELYAQALADKEKEVEERNDIFLEADGEMINDQIDEIKDLKEQIEKVRADQIEKAIEAVMLTEVTFGYKYDERLRKEIVRQIRN